MNETYDPNEIDRIRGENAAHKDHEPGGK